VSGAPNRRRVVVTGLGAVSPLGIGAATLHDRWTQGVCGIVDGEAACRDFDAKEFLSIKEARRLDRFSQFALVASSEAIEQAGWGEELPYDPIRIGCVVATGIGGIGTVETQHDVMRDKGANRVSPLGIPAYMPNAAAAAVSMKHGLQGQMYGVVSACSGGAHALGSALRMIQYGDADAALAGGAEATLTEFGYACFNSMQALSDGDIAALTEALRALNDLIEQRDSMCPSDFEQFRQAHGSHFPKSNGLDELPLSHRPPARDAPGIQYKAADGADRADGDGGSRPPSIGVSATT